MVQDRAILTIIIKDECHSNIIVIDFKVAMDDVTIGSCVWSIRRRHFQ